MPPRARSRANARRSRGSVAVALASVLSAELSIAACPVSAVPVPPVPPLAPAEEVVAEVLAAGPPDDVAAHAIPPPTRKPARVTPTPQRTIRCLRGRPEGSDVPAE